MTTYLPVLVAAAALVLTYLFCIRPLRSGRGLPRPGAWQHDPLGGQELERARTDLERLQRCRREPERREPDRRGSGA